MCDGIRLNVVVCGCVSSSCVVVRGDVWWSVVMRGGMLTY